MLSIANCDPFHKVSPSVTVRYTFIQFAKKNHPMTLSSKTVSSKTDNNFIHDNFTPKLYFHSKPLSSQTLTPNLNSGTPSWNPLPPPPGCFGQPWDNTLWLNFPWWMCMNQFVHVCVEKRVQDCGTLAMYVFCVMLLLLPLTWETLSMLARPRPFQHTKCSTSDGTASIRI